MLQIWTDGACLKNPGPGGWAWMIHGIVHSGGEAHTTNNRMELMGIIEALEKNPGFPVQIFSDSNYCCQAINDWLPGWIARDYRKANGDPVANADLMRRLSAAMQGRKVQAQWVKGHAGIPENEKVDRAASLMAHKAQSNQLGL